MVRTLSNVEDEETPDSSSPTERKRVGQKGNTSRSKHSETEQRRRSRINERFQILRNLIPENDQKRDRASFLLEVIQYIQFLHEKLQIYEGSCQGWSPESTKLTSWKMNPGPVESYVDQSHLEKLLAGHEDNLVQSRRLQSNGQNSVQSDLIRAALHKPMEKLQMTSNQDLPLNIPPQPLIFDSMHQPYEGSFPDSEQFTQQQGRSCLDNCSHPIYNRNEEEMKTEDGEDNVADAYSQGLLNSLTNALQSSGVDLSQANISVQLDIRKGTDDRSTAAIFDTKDHKNLPGLHENYEHPQKRLRADESW